MSKESRMLAEAQFGKGEYGYPAQKQNTLNRRPYLFPDSLKVTSGNSYPSLPDTKGPGTSQSSQEIGDLGDFSTTWNLSHLSMTDIGIDMVSIAVLLHENDIDGAFLSVLFGPGKTGGKISIQGYPQIHGSWNVYLGQLNLRFNPSNLSRPLGYELCPIQALDKCVDAVIRAVFRYGGYEFPPYDNLALMTPRVNKQTGELAPIPQVWQETVVLNAIDIARDVTTKDSRFSMNQMGEIHPKGYPAIVHYRNDGQLNTLTHTSGRKSPRFKFYNKAVERAKKIKEGRVALEEFQVPTYRFEVHIPRTYLKKTLSIDTLADLTPDEFFRIAHLMWEKSNSSTPLVWEGQKTQELLNAGAPRSQVFEFLGSVEARYQGVNFEPYSSCDDEFMKILKEVGFSDTQPINKQGTPYAQWNFWSGSLEIL